MQLEIIQPDDFHHHFRDGDALAHVVPHAERYFSRAIAMPNLKPPVRNLADARAYLERIRANSRKPDFTPLMTLYLTDSTTPDEVQEAKESGLVYGVKYYPAGATTNSHMGVTSIDKVHHVLERMEEIGLPLLIHGEVTDPNSDIFDREAEFLEQVLAPLLRRHAQLRVVLEHVTTQQAVEFVQRSSHARLAATITPHHLAYNRNALFRGGVCVHLFCLPVLKREQHRQALVGAATSGSPRFFLGTDSAPHAVENKESACGCAGIFNAPCALEVCAEVFEEAGALDKLEGFASVFGAQFYGLPLNSKKVTLVREDWCVPSAYSFGGSLVRPLRAGETVRWRVLDAEAAT